MPRDPAAALPWRVEETCFNAFPALRQVLLDGWLLRFSEGLSRRANSANPLRPGCAPVETIIEQVEALYRGQGLPTIFRIPTVAEPAIEAALAARDYTAEGETCVLHSAMAALAAAPDAAVELSAHAGGDFLAAMGALQGHNAAQRGIYRRIVRGVAVPVRFAALRIDGRVAALAYGALHDGLLCYESVITDPRRRRQGLARRVIAALADWARQESAGGACLQVEATNAPALALYAAFGLAELHRYRYWRAPPG